MIIQYKKTTFLSHPFALMNFVRGNKQDLHEAIIIRAAKTLLGKNYNSKEAKKYIEEIRNGEFVPMNTMPGVTLPGISLHIYSASSFISLCVVPSRK